MRTAAETADGYSGQSGCHMAEPGLRRQSAVQASLYGISLEQGKIFVPADWAREEPG
jgi:hypothetical protein